MKQLLMGLVARTLIATVATMGLWVLGKPVAAAVVGAATFFSWLALIIITTAAVVSWWSANLMQRGAELTLRSQVSDDLRDAILFKAIADLTRSLLQQSQPGFTALPLLEQGQEWLPALNEVKYETD